MISCECIHIISNFYLFEHLIEYSNLNAFSLNFIIILCQTQFLLLGQNISYKNYIKDTQENIDNICKYIIEILEIPLVLILMNKYKIITLNCKVRNKCENIATVLL